MIDPLTLNSVAALSSVQDTANRSEIAQFRESLEAARIPGQLTFSDALVARGDEFVQSLASAETAAVSGIKGEMGVYEVASTVMEAQQQLKMVTAVRDKMVQAYLELSRMQI
ncbi:MAG: flagellar hook-basal body complex protein FliE [Pseudomonadota bacterium]